MSKSNDGESDIQKFTFQGIVPVWSAAAQLYISLHTSDPGEAGKQNTNECAYGSYERLPTNRDITGWTVTDNVASNATVLTFATCSLGTEIITHVGIGTDLTGEGRLIQSYQLTSPLTVNAGTTPYFPVGALQVIEE